MLSCSWRICPVSVHIPLKRRRQEDQSSSPNTLSLEREREREREIAILEQGTRHLLSTRCTWEMGFSKKNAQGFQGSFI